MLAHGRRHSEVCSSMTRGTAQWPDVTGRGAYRRWRAANQPTPGLRIAPQAVCAPHGRSPLPAGRERPSSCARHRARAASDGTSAALRASRSTRSASTSSSVSRASIPRRDRRLPGRRPVGVALAHAEAKWLTLYGRGGSTTVTYASRLTRLRPRTRSSPPRGADLGHRLQRLDEFPQRRFLRLAEELPAPALGTGCDAVLVRLS